MGVTENPNDTGCPPGFYAEGGACWPIPYEGGEEEDENNNGGGGGGTSTPSPSGVSVDLFPKITFLRPPRASFTYKVLNGFVVEFTNTTLGQATFQWTFGDGGSSGLKNPVHVYAGEGIYVVKLIATNGAGSDSEQKTIRLSLEAGDGGDDDHSEELTSKYADFYYLSDGLTVKFYDDSSFHSNKFRWTFGDGYTSSLRNPVHTYNASGTYQVTLLLDDGYMKMRSVIVSNEGVGGSLDGIFAGGECADEEGKLLSPVCIAGDNNQILVGCGGASKTIYEFTRDCVYVSRNIEVGCGSSEKINSPNNIEIYGNELFVNSYNCRELIVFDKNTFEYKRHIDWTDGSKYVNGLRVYNNKVYLSFYTVSPKTLTIKIYDLNLNYQSSIYKENFYATGFYIYNDKIYFVEMGSYPDYRIYVTDLDGNYINETIGYYKDEDLKSFAFPMGIAVVDDYIYVRDGVGVGSSKILVFDLDLNYQWEFTLEGNPYFNFWMDSNYLYITTITDCQLYKYNLSGLIPNGVFPRADFDFSLSGSGVPVTVTFTDKSTGEPTTWLWEFGDGSTSDQQNPSHEYTEAGIYTVRLTVTNALGSSWITKLVVILDLSDIPEEVDNVENNPEESPPEAGIPYYYSVDSENHKVLMYDSEWTYLGWFGGYGTGNGELDTPTTLVVTENYVYVVDSGNHRVQQFDRDGYYVGQFGTYGTGNGEFDTPFGIDTNGIYIYVTDTGNNRVQIFDMDFNYVDQFGSSGYGNGEFDYPCDITIDDHYIYVSDKNNHRFQVFLLTSYEYIYKTGSYGSGTNQFSSPTFIWDDDYYIYIQDPGNNRTVIYPKTNPDFSGMGVISQTLKIINDINADPWPSLQLTLNILQGEALCDNPLQLTLDIIQPFIDFPVTTDIIPDIETEFKKKPQKPSGSVA